MLTCKDSSSYTFRIRILFCLCPALQWKVNKVKNTTNRDWVKNTTNRDWQSSGSDSMLSLPRAWV